jgi:cbb3-type cytochrome c oxidase subunit III
VAIRTWLSRLGRASIVCAGLAWAAYPQPAKSPSPPESNPDATGQEELVRRGRSLFSRNCAHCHGDDARGDEGPSLYDLTKTDRRIAENIKRGIKGEMPSFGTKLDEAAVQALIKYLRTLKE